MKHRSRLSLCLVACCAAVLTVAWFRFLPGKEQSEDEGTPGVQVSFTTLAPGGNGSTDVRSARLVSLYVPAGEAVTPFLPVGPFHAVWQGDLTLELGGEYLFSAEGIGRIKVTLNGTPALEGEGDLAKPAGKSIKLKKGANALVVEYQSPTQGDAQVRLFWRTSEFRREPVPPSVLRHKEDARPLVEARRLREGRELLATLRCLRCHQADTAGLVKAGGMPELALDAASLDGIGSRARAEWLARWIQDPQALRPTATMPHLFPDAPTGDKAKLDLRVRDIAAYLASLGKAPTEEPKAREETVQEGTRLFVHLGCIGCHLPPSQEDFTQDEKKRLPLRDVTAKWRPAALRDFLRQPDKHYQWIRMPNFHLSAEEADRLAAYLLSVERRDVFAALEGKANLERGKQLVQATGCLNCHTLTDGKPLATGLSATAFAELKKESWSRGCLESKENKDRKAPIFGLTDDQCAALRAFAADGRNSLQRESAVEFAARQMHALRCNACHRRDEQEDSWSQSRDEEAGLLAGLPPVDPDKEPKEFKTDQVRPTLTWTGEKLKPAWLVQFLAGQLSYKPRAYLRARMPAFPRRAELLARGLAFEHGCPPRSEPGPAPDEKRTEIGRDLVSKRRWGCAACHDLGKTAAVGVFEAPGPNFMHIKERLRREYYDRWMWAPTRVEMGTKMPTVYTYGKRSLLADVLDGDSAGQIDAIWQYILLGERIKPPPE